MRRFFKHAPLIGLALFLTILLAACQREAAPPAPTTAGIAVEITGSTCPNMVVQVGQVVSWANQSNGDHVVRDTTIAGASQFDSGTLKPGDTFAFTFPEPAIYTYDCSPDGEQTGTITVER